MSRKNSKQNISDKEESKIYKPAWIKPLSSKQFQELADIYMFFVLNTPIVEESSQSKAISSYGWNEQYLWTDKYYFIEKINHILFDDKQSFSIVKTFDELDEKLLANDIDKNKLHLYQEELFLFKNCDKRSGIEDNYYSFFYHIRNAFAHGIFSVNDHFIIIEDRSKNYNRTNCVIIIKIKKLREVINFIVNYQDKEYIDYAVKIYRLIRNRVNQKKNICDILKLSDEKYNYYINKLKSSNKIQFSDSIWRVIN